MSARANSSACRRCAGGLHGLSRRAHPDDWDAIQERYAEAINQPGGGDYIVEHRAFSRDGGVRHLVGVGRVICDPEGEPLRVLGFTREK